LAVLSLLSKKSRPSRLAAAGAGLLLLGIGGAIVWAQIDGDRGIAPVASTGDFEVTGIDVNTTGKDADEARMTGWRTATRLAWQKLGTQRGPGGVAPALDDGTLLGMVSAVTVEHEEIWADFHTGESVIDYVRPNGGGADGLLIDAGQVSRRSRNWWRSILDQYGAEDVVIPIARLQREYPGGPIKGTFTARHGPDNAYLGSFELTADSEDKLPAMLSEAVKRCDALFAQALAAGQLKPDPSLNSGPQIDPKLIAGIVDKMPPPRASARAAAPGVSVTSGSGPAAATVQVQFVSPDATAVDAAQGALRAIPGVSAVTTSSLAIGGVSVVRVAYSGDVAALATALRAEGWKVTQGSGVLMMRR